MSSSPSPAGSPHPQPLDLNTITFTNREDEEHPWVYRVSAKDELDFSAVRNGAAQNYGDAMREPPPDPNDKKPRDRMDFIWLLRGSVMVIRTNSCASFAKDFFLPSVVNFALRANNIVVKIFGMLALLPYDLLTFPIRVITLIPRFIYNAKAAEAHLLLKWFNTKKRAGVDVPASIFEAERLQIEVALEDKTVTTYWVNPRPIPYHDAETNQTTTRQNVKRAGSDNLLSRLGADT